MKVPNNQKKITKKENSFLSELKSKTHSKFYSNNNHKNKKPNQKEAQGKEDNQENEEEQNLEAVEEMVKLKSAENFNKPRSKSPVNISDKTLIYELRNSFQKSLAKLNNRDTKEVGYKELVSIITKFNNSQSLRVFIGLISISHKNCSLAAKELQVMLIGVIAQVFQENLQDPLDKPPSIIKTVDRLIRVIQGFMKENSDVIHYACAETLVQLYQHCMPKDDIVQIVKLFIDYPVASIESGINLMAQKASSLALSSIIAYFKEEGGVTILNQITPSIIRLVLRTNFDSPYLFEALISLIHTVKFDFFANNLKELYEKIIVVLENPKTLDNSKINCCILLKEIAEILKTSASNLIGFYISDITNALKNATRDRVHKIQIIAREALKSWIEVERISLELEAKKMNIVVEKGDFDDMEDLKNKILKKLDTREPSLTEEKAEGKDKKHLKLINQSIFNYNNQNKLNMLRNLSKLNKEDTSSLGIFNRAEVKSRGALGHVKAQNISKDELFKKGISNMLRISGSQEKDKQQPNENDYYEHHLKYGKNIVKGKVLPSAYVKESMKKYLNSSMDMGVGDKELYSNEDMEGFAEADMEAESGEADTVPEKKGNVKEQKGMEKVRFDKNHIQQKNNKITIDLESKESRNQGNKEYSAHSKSNRSNTMNISDHEKIREKTESRQQQLNDSLEMNNQVQDSEKRKNLPSHSPKFTQKRIENKLSNNKLTTNKSNKHSSNNSTVSITNKSNKNSLGLDKNQIENIKSSLNSVFTNTLKNSIANFNHLNQRLNILDKKITGISGKTNIALNTLNKANTHINNISKQVKTKTLNDNRTNSYADKKMEEGLGTESEKSLNSEGIIKNTKAKGGFKSNKNLIAEESKDILVHEKEYEELLKKNQRLEKENLEQREELEAMNKEINSLNQSNKRKGDSNSDPDIVKQWKKIISLAEKGDYNGAYSEALLNGDDIYLLRLLCLTGPNLGRLKEDMAKKLVFRVNMIARSHQIENIILSLIRASYEQKQFNLLTKNEQNDLLETLFEISGLNSKVGKTAGKLYSKILQS
eukprot:CAMPEP_0170519710 /NCGR_PEP_ID=MMETSP0209-20121228/5023_1 /TAXON_ID=665100 ORGANISM="Litonotus pictus, Strain P1" /NCGR_SAMPLE_ID=MMETSP0209 /ASSEMBLY_ACC=CAM_ASM_000301 /LENGTH=1049 /DNA_ID=CAMNT_0010805661 /DNA_START=45 /DNA_END=3194 /DNA_ORIENTATION=+